MQVEWKGVFTALVTPFKDDNSLDEDGLKTLVARQLEAGVQGLLPCGTTGESPALSEEEWERVIDITVSEANGKAWIVAGSGTNNTDVSIRRTRKVADLGADGALVITPYYNKPTPEGMMRHFGMVAESVPYLPIMVYNVPSRTGVNLQPGTVEKLAEIENIVAVKEASGNLAQVWDIVGRIVGSAAVFSGEDGLNLPILDVGGVGSVSVVSNIVPELSVEQWKARNEGQGARAYELHRELAGLSKALFVETSPAPAKYALGLLGLPGGPVRPPLAQLSEQSQGIVAAELKKLKLI